MVTGWVEATPVRYDARSISVGISGRSLTADLIDCAAEPTQFNGQSLVQVASALARPFGIAVINAGAPGSVIPGVQPDHGETVIEVLNKMLDNSRRWPTTTLEAGLLSAALVVRALIQLWCWVKTLFPAIPRKVSVNVFQHTVSGQRAGNDDDFGAATTTALRAKQQTHQLAAIVPWQYSRRGSQQEPVALRVLNSRRASELHVPMKPRTRCGVGDREMVLFGSQTSGLLFSIRSADSTTANSSSLKSHSLKTITAP